MSREKRKKVKNRAKGLYLMKIPPLVLFNDLNFEIIKFNFFYEIVLRKPRLAVPLKVGDSFVQPEWFSQIKLVAHLIQCPENFMGAGIVTVVGDHGIF